MIQKPLYFSFSPDSHPLFFIIALTIPINILKEGLQNQKRTNLNTLYQERDKKRRKNKFSPDSNAFKGKTKKNVGRWSFSLVERCSIIIKNRINLYPNEYTPKMYLIEKTATFDKWLRKLKDLRAKAKILLRIKKVTNLL